MIVKLPIEISNIQEPDRRTGVIEVIADTGSVYCWIPKDELEKIGILVKGKRLFRTKSGERVERTFGYARFTYDGVSGGSEVVFAEPNDGNILGALAMEGMG